MLAFRREDEHAAGAGGPDVALGVEPQAVAPAGAFLALQSGGEEDVAQAGAIKGAGGHARVLAIGDREIEGLLVEAQGDAVRPLDFLGHEGDLAVGRELVDAVVRGLGLLAFRQAVGRIGEVDRAILGHAEIVRAVEAHAFVVLGRERHELAVATEAGDAARAVLAEQEAAFAVDREAVGALVRRSLVGAARLEEDGGDRIAFDPLVGDVVGDVGEDDASLIPSRAFGPGIASVRDGLDLGVACEQGVERRIEFLDGLLRALGGEGGQDGE